MKFTISFPSLLRGVLLLAASCLSMNLGLAAPPNPIVAGNARFTVITPNLIRMEYQPGGQFVDLPSLFAGERAARTVLPFTVTPGNGSTVIDTGEMRLTYMPDGRPFDPTNLFVMIQNSPTMARWVPGMNDPANLGGTIQTLDGIVRPVDVGQGVLSRSGWAVIDDSQTPLLTSDGWVQSRPDAQKTGQDWYLFGYGGNYRAALSSLMTVSGSVPMPRRYALGTWYSRYWPWSEDDYKSIVTRYGTEDFPLDNVVLDMDWHKDGWTGWSWNPKLLPDAPGLLTWFHSQGLHATLNLHPSDGVAPYEDQYAPFMKALNLDPASGKTVPFDSANRSYMNALFTTVFAPLTQNGVDFWWLDWQQYPYTLSVPDLTNLFWLNTQLFDYTAAQGQRGMSFSRWAGWGDQRHPIHFSGDANTGFPMLAFEVPFTATAGNVGCFFWSHDIGGHMGGRNEESYARWCQFGATSPVLRSHSTRDPLTDRAPWNYPQWAEDSMRISFHLRSELFPYIYTSAHEACAQNVPLDRPLYLDLADQEDAYHNGQEYLLGDNMLVAPIATAGAGPGHVAAQTVWFPPTQAGYWYNYFTGERFAQKTNILAAADIDEFPLYVRGGVPLPSQPYTPRMGTTPIQILRIRCYPGADGQVGKLKLYEDDGLTTGYERGESATTALTFHRHGIYAKVFVAGAVGSYTGQPLTRSYIIELHDIGMPTSVTVDGHPVPYQFDYGNGATIRVGPLSIRQPVTLLVTGYQPGVWDILHNLALNRRLSGAVGGFNYTGLGSGLLSAALKPSTVLTDQDAAFAAAGIGLVHKNVATTFYPEAYQDLLFVPYNSVAGNVVTLADGSQLPVPSVGLNGVPIGPVPGHHLKVSFAVGGQTYFVPASANGILGDDNFAQSAVVTASSVQPSYGSSAAAAVDGIVSGYPSDNTKEWASNSEHAGAWLQLTWPTPQTVDRIWLYDRPNADDQVTAGTITFSDGTTVSVGLLPNDASTPFEIAFPPKTITWLKFTVTTVSATTQNVGLSEIAVFKAGSHPSM